MDRYSAAAFAWFAARPVIIYTAVVTILREMLYRILETVLLARGADMALFYGQWQSVFTMLILAAVHTAAVIPVIREGKYEIAWRERRDSWMAHRRDQSLLTMLMIPAVLCMAVAVNEILLRFTAGTGGDLRGWRLSMAVLVYGFVTPFTEELVFRGLFFGRLRRKLCFLYAGLVSAAVFGLCHGNLWQAAYGFVMGFLFAAAYELTGRFVIPYLLHAVTNIVIAAASGLGFMDTPASPMWCVFWLCGAGAVLTYYVMRLKETGWDPLKRPDGKNRGDDRKE